MRGEYCRIRGGTSWGQGSPPLARGVRSLIRSDIPHAGITPACAGSTLVMLSVLLHHKDHPRLRGEYQKHTSKLSTTRGSPPLARGVHNLRMVKMNKVRITPACAGSTQVLLFLPFQSRDHPRLRGEYQKHTSKLSTTRGSPPLARGVQNLGGSFVAAAGITPACAGSTAGWLRVCWFC